MSDAEWQTRADFAASYRLMDHFGVQDLTYQIGALAGGSDILIPADDVCRKAADTMASIEAPKNGGKNWGACLRLTDRLFPDLRS